MPIAAKIAATLLVIGICLMVASVAWERDLGFNRGFTDEDALEYSEASAALHDAMHESSHSHGEDSGKHERTDLPSAQIRFDAAQARPDKALTSREWTSRLMKWSGLVITIASTVTLCLKRD